MLDWNKMPEYIYEATTRFLRVANKLPIKFISTTLVPNGEKKYFIYLEDAKLTKWYKENNLAGDGKFKALVTDGFLYDHTQGIDLAAHIPPMMQEEKKVVLRIAYTILISWQKCFIEAYKLVAQNKYDVTFANAKKWYEELK